MKKWLSILLSLAMVSGMLCMPVSAAEASWYDGWSIGTAVVSEDGETVVMSAQNGATSGISVNRPANLGNTFDIEFTAEVPEFGGNEHMVFATGTGYKGIVYIKENSFAGLPFEVGNTPHTYRILGEGAIAEVYADGMFLGLFPLTSDDGYARMYFQFKSPTAGSAEMRIHDVTFSAYSGSQATEEMLNPAKRNLSYDFNSSADGWTSPDGSWFLKDGTYRVENTNSTEGYYATAYLYPIVYPGENFRIEMRTKFEALSHQQAFNVSWPGYQFTIRPRATYFEYVTGKNTVTEYVGELLDATYHDIVVETYNGGSMVRFLVDDMLLVDEPAKTSTEITSSVSWSVASQGGRLSSILMDSFSFTISQEKLAIETIEQKAIYSIGSEIAVSAKGVYLDEAPDKVEYRIGNEIVATGTAPDYSATIPNLGVGNYEIVATAQNKALKSGMVSFSVVPEEGILSASVIDDTLNASVSGLSGYTKEYLLDGKMVGTGDSVAITGITPERHNLLVICKNDAGFVMKTFSETVTPDIANHKSSHFSNDISYSVSGDAIVDFSNGNHRLWMKHTADALLYLTDEGEKTYADGLGDFEVITDGSVADVYRNGQLVFSYLMPMTDAAETIVEGVENFTLSIPEKNNYFIGKDVSDAGKRYNLGEIPYYHNLDFVAEQTDEVRFVLNDGYYRSDLLIQNGKMYALAGTLKDAKSRPTYTYLADMVEGMTFYRVETAYGICRVYGNGRFLTAYQAVPGGGTGSLYVDVQKGTLEYVAVNDNKDLRMFKDSFDGSGAVSSEQFWQTSRMTTTMNEGSVFLTPDAGEKGILTWNAYATDFDLATKLKVDSCNGGFWFILGHGTKDSYTKVGYNAVSKKYEIVEVQGTNETILAEKSVGWSSPVGTDLSVSLSAKRTGDAKAITATFKGGSFINTTISTELVAHRAGTFGILLDDATATLYDMNYCGDAMLLNGLVNQIYDKESGIIKTADLVIEDEDTMFFMQKQSAYRDYSYDGGRTWRKSNVSRVGDNYNAVRLRSGKLLGTLLEGMGNGKKAYTVYLSPNNGESWERLGIMQEPEPTFYAGQNRMMETDYGRVFFITGVGKGDESSGDVHRVFYSDNEGTTWVESENCIDPEQIGMVVDEAVLVQVSDTVMRCYFRTDTGFIRYIESPDKGVTWDNQKVYSTPFASAANCFNVERDMETGFLYLAWGYDNVNLCGMIQLPRTRWAVAMSRDNGTTWEYVGTGHEDNERVGSTMMNLSINVAPKNLILSGYSSDHGITVQQGARRIAISKEQIPSMRFDQLHYCEDGLMNSYLNVADAKKALVIKSETTKLSGANLPPDGVGYLPDVVWSDDFADGDLEGWTEKVAGFEIVSETGNPVLHASATETEGGAEIQVQNGALDMDGKDFTFRFKQKLSGGEKGFGNLGVTFGSNTTAKTHNVGYANTGLGMEMDTWYEWAYVYRFDSACGTHRLDIYSRQEESNGGWSEWCERVTGMMVETIQATERQNRFVLTFPKVSGNQLATDIWYDDFSVYLHQSAIASGLVNGYVVENVSDGRFVSVDTVATMLGASVTRNASGMVSFTRGNSVITFGKDDVTIRNRKEFVGLDLLKNRYGLKVEEFGDVQIVSEDTDWTGRQQQIFAGLAGMDDAGLILPDRMHCYVNESFAEPNAPNYIVTGSARVKDSALHLESGDSFEVKDLVIPEGGYADFCIKGEKVILTLCDGTDILALTDSNQEVWMDYRVIRAIDGEYSVYSKKADESKWRLRMTEGAPAKGSQEIGICLSNPGDGITEVDSLQVYGPATNQTITVVDGATSNLIPNGGTGSYQGNIRILLNLNEVEKRQGVVAGYSESGAMVAMEMFDVLPGEKEMSYTTKQMTGANIQTIKVFVWSDFLDLNPVVSSYVVKRKLR